MPDATAKAKGSPDSTASLSVSERLFGLPPAFAEAWINSEHTVCGVKLPAYSMHSHLMLSVMESPFALESLPSGFKLTWEDLWLAVFSVSTPYGKQVKFPPAWRCIFRQRFFRMDLATEVAKFRAWQNDHLTAPEVFCSEGDGRPLTAPGILARVVFMQRHLNGYTAEQLWTMPIGQAMWIHAATLEQVNEHVSLLEDKDAAIFALIKSIQDGTASPDVLPPDPAEIERGDKLGRAADALGVNRSN